MSSSDYEFTFKYGVRERFYIEIENDLKRVLNKLIHRSKFATFTIALVFGIKIPINPIFSFLFPDSLTEE